MGTLAIVLGVVVAVEAVFIICLICRNISDKNQMKKVISQADEIKKRRVDIDDIEISDTSTSQGAIGDAINVIKNNLSKRSHFGTEDDISLSCIYDADLLREKLNLINERVAENKQAAADRKTAALSKQVEVE